MLAGQTGFSLRSSKALVACLGLFFALGLSACSPSSGEIQAGAYVVNVPAAKVDGLIKQAKVTCASSNEASCPSSVGMLVTLQPLPNNQVAIGRCTGFLASPTIVITNSHCVPKDLRDAGTSLRDKVILVFAANAQFDAETVPAKEVVFASTIAEEGDPAFGRDPDYAIIRLAKPASRPPLQLSRLGLPDALSLRVLAVDPSLDDQIQGKMRVKSCTTVQGSLVIPGFIHPFHPIAGSDGCEIVHGNSGSPAVSDDGRVRAVAYAYMEPQTKSVIKFEDGTEGPKKTFHGVAMMTNLACMSLPGELASVGLANKECGRVTTPNALESSAWEKVGDNTFLAPFTAWKAKAPRSLRFKLKTMSAEGVELSEVLKGPEIECVDDLKFLGKDVAKSESATIKFSAPVWGLQPDVDLSYRYTIQAAEVNHAETEIAFNPRELIAEGRTLGAMKVKNVANGRVFDVETTLRLCSAK